MTSRSAFARIAATSTADAPDGTTVAVGYPEGVRRGDPALVDPQDQPRADEAEVPGGFRDRRQALQRALVDRWRVAHPQQLGVEEITVLDDGVGQLVAADNTDLYDINEAFAVVTMAAMKDHDLDHAIVNVRGSGCSIGHPIGASGARVLATLIYAMKDTGAATGMASLCLGGGEAVAMSIEMMI